MDSLNSLAFGGEPPRPEYLSEPAQGKIAPLLSRNVMMQIAWTTLGFCGVFAVLSLLHKYGLFVGAGAYMSARFALLVIMSVVNGFCVRARGYNIFSGLRANPMFIIVAAGIILSTIFVVTFGGSVLQLSTLSYGEWLYVFGLSLLIVPINAIKRLLMTSVK
jgi:magnesium-transporting ATPase (P-type)